jgi:hypothetical protein
MERIGYDAVYAFGASLLLDGFNVNADFADNGPLTLQRLGTAAP